MFGWILRSECQESLSLEQVICSCFHFVFSFFSSLEYYEKKSNVQARVGKKRNVGAEQENKVTAAETQTNSWRDFYGSSKGAKQIEAQPLDLNSAQNQIQLRTSRPLFIMREH